MLVFFLQHSNEYILTLYAVLSSTEFCRSRFGTLLLGAGCGCAFVSVEVCLLDGGCGADRLPTLLRFKLVGIAGAGRVGRILPFSADCDVCSDNVELIDCVSLFESSECTLTSSCYNF